MVGWNVIRRGDQINLEKKPSRRKARREAKKAVER